MSCHSVLNNGGGGGCISVLLLLNKKHKFSGLHDWLDPLPRLK